MFRHFLLFGLLLMTVSCAGKPLHKDVPAATGNNFAQALSQAEAPLVTRLENGLTVLIKEDDRFPLVNVRLYVHAGSAYEDPAQAGISHLLEHMVFKGSAGRAPGETARVIESVGGSLNAGTSWDYTVYYVEVPDEEWKLGLETVRDMSFHANIDPAELASGKGSRAFRTGTRRRHTRLQALQDPAIHGLDRHKLPMAHYRLPGNGFRSPGAGHQRLHCPALPAPIHAAGGHGQDRRGERAQRDTRYVRRLCQTHVEWSPQTRSPCPSKPNRS